MTTLDATIFNVITDPATIAEHTVKWLSGRPKKQSKPPLLANDAGEFYDPAAAREQIGKYVDAVYQPDDLIEIRLLPTGKSYWRKAKDVPALAVLLSHLNSRDKQHIYIGANPRRSENVRGDENVSLARCVFADFDRTSVHDTRQNIDASGLPIPTLLINSGHGCHAYWKLDTPIHDLVLWTTLQKGLAALLNSDSVVCNPERIMRLPGFTNHKPPVAQSKLIECDATRIHLLADLQAVIPAVEDKPQLAPPVPAVIVQGGRDNTLTSLAGTMRRRGMSQESILAALLKENETKCIPPLPVADVERIARSISKHLPASIESTPWLPFPVDELPVPIARFVRELADALICDESAIAVLLLVALASAIGNSRWVRIKRDWFEPCILWAMLVAVSGSKKSPILYAAMQFVIARQRALQKMYKEQLAEHELALAKWNAMPKEKRPVEKPEKPEYPHVYADDVTVEGLVMLLDQTPRGLIMFKDELSALFGGFNQYKGGGGSDEQSYLPMYSGRPVKVVRKTADKPTLYVPRAAVSIVGGIQPTVMQEAFTPGRFQNGLASRFIFVYPPEKDGPGWTESSVNPNTVDAVARIFNSLYGLFPEANGDPKPVHLADDAKDAFADFVNQNKIERLAMGDTPLAAAWSKFEALPARLALILQMVGDTASNSPQPPTMDSAGQLQPEYIFAEAMQSGLAITRWLQNESKRVYTLFARGPADPQMELLAWIRSEGGRVTTRDLQRHSRNKYPTSESAELELSKLVTAGLAHREVVRPENGRPGTYFVLNE